MNTLSVLLFLAANLVIQVDFEGAFLHIDLKEVYMRVSTWIS